MKIDHSRARGLVTPDAAVEKALSGVCAERLRSYVEQLAFPRHYFAEHRANRKARDLIVEHCTGFGYTPFLQGSCDNIVMTSSSPSAGPLLLLGAHYDSVPATPGADDNASALAVCLECARLIREQDAPSVMIVSFNREEDGLLGSREFVANLTEQTSWQIKEAHIFEMVGYRDHTPGSQRIPAGLPITAPETGDFLALLANRTSNAIAEDVLTLAAAHIPDCTVLALKIYFGLEKTVSHLHRSDHAPFWQAGIPSIMWTDTSEFRNPHYHRASDTPDTLDYEFMRDVAKLALARALTHTK